MDMMYTGRSVSADEALAMGLVREWSLTSGSWTRPWRMPSRSRHSPPSRCNSQSAHWFDHFDSALLAQLELEWSYQVAAFDTDDAREGITAFRERRPPRFGGS